MDAFLSLKTQLIGILPKYPELKVSVSKDYTNLQLKEIAWVVEDFVNQNPEVIEDDDQLKDWLDRYRFFSSSSKGQPTK